MVGGTWQIGRTGPELADAWGLAEGTVRGDASDASAQIREATPDLADEVRVMALALVEQARDLAALEPDVGRRARLLLDVASTAHRIAGPPRRGGAQLELAPGGAVDPDELPPWMVREDA